MIPAGPRFVIALSIVVASAAAALHQTPRRAHAYVPTPLPPTFSAQCRLEGDEARAHAQALEQRAVLRWQRAPFEAGEGTRARQLIAEAEVCFRAAGDRSGAQRARSLHRRYVAESEQREAADRVLLLRAAVHEESAP